MKDPVIVIVHEEAPLRRSLSRALERLGATVHTARTAAETEALLTTRRVDALLVDLALADARLDGVHVLRRARELAPAALRVLISGQRTPRVEVTLDTGVAEHFLGKPFGLSVIARVYEIIVAR